ncbi:shikimate kinase [Candidatus Cyanaurora vandensis]|uniref:shikimate kinase n=1 Tax=Candidatus Cyanaurora vandensis TaxID=2714958 RepID=UPI00257B54F3|nr:shikimate kinase [Candidatus Cyanaurora vandensis]
MLKNTNVYLVGMMGAGKSTVGAVLAKALGYHYFDTDTLITQATGLTIPELFAQGESVFREVETQVLSQLAPHTRLVVATGGGVVLSPRNWAYLHTGVVVWLEVPAELLWQRVQGKTSRPLLVGGRERLTEILTERLELYRQADVTVTGTETAEAVSGVILAAIQARILADEDYIQRFIGR